MYTYQALTNQQPEVFLQIIMAHGCVISTGAKAALREGTLAFVTSLAQQQAASAVAAQWGGCCSCNMFLI
jgi:hypothetical protein